MIPTHNLVLILYNALTNNVTVRAGKIGPAYPGFRSSWITQIEVRKKSGLKSPTCMGRGPKEPENLG